MICNCFDIIKRSAENGTIGTTEEKIVIGVSGASGTIYAINLVKKLKEYPMIETHGIISPWAKQNLKLESDLSLTEFESLFDYHYSNKDLGAAVASGSF